MDTILEAETRSFFFITDRPDGRNCPVGGKKAEDRGNGFTPAVPDIRFAEQSMQLRILKRNPNCNPSGHQNLNRVFRKLCTV